MTFVRLPRGEAPPSCASDTSCPPRDSAPRSSSSRRSRRAGRVRLRRDQRPLPPVARRAGPLAVRLDRARRDRRADRAARPGHRRDLPDRALPPGDHRAGRGHAGDRLGRPVHARASAPASGSTSTSSGRASRASGAGTSGCARRWRSSTCSGRAATSRTRASTCSWRTPGCSTCRTTLPLIAVAAGGKQAAELAAEHGDRPVRHRAARRPGRGVHARPAARGPRYAEVPMAWAPTEEAAVAGGARDHPLGGDRLEGDERAAQPGELRGRVADRPRRGHPRAVRGRPGRRAVRGGGPAVRRRRLRPHRAA